MENNLQDKIRNLESAIEKAVIRGKRINLALSISLAINTYLLIKLFIINHQ